MPSLKPPIGFLARNLLDGAKPYRYRSRVRRLLGLTEDTRPRVYRTPATPPVGFQYLENPLPTDESQTRFPMELADQFDADPQRRSGRPSQSPGEARKPIPLEPRPTAPPRAGSGRKTSKEISPAPMPPGSDELGGRALVAAGEETAPRVPAPSSVPLDALGSKRGGRPASPKPVLTKSDHLEVPGVSTSRCTFPALDEPQDLDASQSWVPTPGEWLEDPLPAAPPSAAGLEDESAGLPATQPVCPGPERPHKKNSVPQLLAPPAGDNLAREKELPGCIRTSSAQEAAATPDPVPRVGRSGVRTGLLFPGRGPSSPNPAAVGQVPMPPTRLAPLPSPKYCFPQIRRHSAAAAALPAAGSFDVATKSSTQSLGGRASRVEQLRQAVHRLAAKVSATSPKGKSEPTSQPPATKRPAPVPPSSPVFVAPPAHAAPAAFWERSYLSRWRLRTMR